MVICWEKVDPLALLFVMFSCVLVTFPYEILDQVCRLIVWSTGLSLLAFYLTFTMDTNIFQASITVIPPPMSIVLVIYIIEAM